MYGARGARVPCSGAPDRVWHSGRRKETKTKWASGLAPQLQPLLVPAGAGCCLVAAQEERLHRRGPPLGSPLHSRPHGGLAEGQFGRHKPRSLPCSEGFTGGRRGQLCVSLPLREFAPNEERHHWQNTSSKKRTR
ncbi:unnamed protein product [Pleuronectes platessa]|uniref:Uncharacterized protein n=1 Tax=Pleuronectes platessa TaxID=8262 RepID=A0A9N7U954_PLEPL|nr:unnamed protein product [Pleuronectes platessa]